MWILMLEAVGALLLLVFIVWWTAYSGRDAAARARAKPPVPKENDTPEP
jgi:hypothetical protein